MDLTRYLKNEGEKPLERIVTDGGFCCVFRTLACIGDSLASGELESLDENGNKGWHDYFEYSWLQFLARKAGFKGYNFTRGGMTAKEYMESFAESKGFWNPELAAQGYILALGVNDIHQNHELGSAEDICLEDYRKNAKTFAGYYGAIIQRYKEIQPKARMFLITVPRKGEAFAAHAKLLYDIAEKFDYTYVIDLQKYAPDYETETFRKNFFLAGHLNVAGYKLSADIIGSYIDYIIRNNPEDFTQIGFVGTDFHNVNAKW